MLKKIYLGLIMMLFWVQIYAQDASFYLPYQMPTHTAVKFNTFLMNPSLPLLGYQEQNVGIYYRNQWMGFKNDNFALMGLSYGLNWNQMSSANAFAYKRNAGVISNIGVVFNYGHYVEFSSDAGLRLGLNVIPMYSGIDRGRIVVLDESDPLLAVKKTFGLTAQPGFDFNIGNVEEGAFHVGITAENLFDYSFSQSKSMTPFSDKTFTGHLMYRASMDGSDMFENGHWSLMFRAIKDPESINIELNGLIDLPKLGWLYGGYTKKYGVFTGLGFNLYDFLSMGIEYENGIGAKIPQLGSTFGVHINMQFGGDRQQSAREELERQKRRREQARQRALERIERNKAKEAIPPPIKKEPEVVKPTTPVKPEQEREVNSQLTSNSTIKVRKDNIAGDKISPGYYVIVGVYQDPRNAFRVVQELRKKYDVAVFIHPRNRMNYVYIGGGSLSSEEAENLYRKNLFNPDFNTAGRIWILEVGK